MSKTIMDSINLKLWEWGIRRWFMESMPLWVAHHLPKQLVMWCVVRVMAQATSGKWGNTHPSSLDIMTMLKRWDENN